MLRDCRSFAASVGLAVALLLGSAACHRSGAAAPPAGVVASVNGQPIPAAELDALFQEQNSGAPLVPEQATRLRLSLLDQLIDRHILLQYAARQGIVADPARVSHELDLARARDPDRPEAALRQQVTESLILQQLMQQEVDSRVQVSDAAIDDFYHENASSFQLPERQYHVLEIVVTSQAVAVTNLSGDKAATLADARKKARMLEQKLRAGADFAALAEQYSEDPNTASSGGDLGLIPQSALTQATSPALRDAILAMHPGQISPIIASGDALYLLKLVDIEPAGVRKLSDPEVRQSIRDVLANGREQLLQTAFLTTVRDQARVENYLAERVLRDGGTDAASDNTASNAH